MSFALDNRGIKTVTDATPEAGGHDAGPTPKELVLNAMLGCTAMDVVSILRKTRQEFTAFTMDNEAEKTADHPIHFKTSLLTFRVEGPVASDKLLKAVEASLTKYCGVNYMISLSCEISYLVLLNGSEVGRGKVAFSPQMAP
jgi:putative redox protein